MHRGDDAVGIAGDERARLDGLVALLPALPEPGEREGALVLEPEVIRGLSVLSLPLIKAIGGSEAATLLEGVTPRNGKNRTLSPGTRPEVAFRTEIVPWL